MSSTKHSAVFSFVKMAMSLVFIATIVSVVSGCNVTIEIDGNSEIINDKPRVQDIPEQSLPAKNDNEIVDH